MLTDIGIIIPKMLLSNCPIYSQFYVCFCDIFKFEREKNIATKGMVFFNIFFTLLNPFENPY